MDDFVYWGLAEPFEDAYDLKIAIFDSQNPPEEKAILYFSSSLGFLHHHSQSEVSFAHSLVSKNCRSGWAVCSPA